MARFKYLNLNPNGLRIDDCVIRAISFASDIPYEETSRKLWLTADLYECDRLCKFCYSNYLSNVLKYKEVNARDMTVGEFTDTHPYGTYLIRVQGHLTVIRDGVIYDTWDTSDEECDIVWQVD